MRSRTTGRLGRRHCSLAARIRHTAAAVTAATLLAGCGGPSKPAAPLTVQDRDLLNAAVSGQQAFARGAYDIAAEQYRRALSMARRRDDAMAVGDQAYNLAVALAALGQMPEAQDRLAESQAALRRAGAPLADVLLVEARLLHAQATAEHLPADAAPKAQQLTLAEQAAERVLTDPASRPTAAHRMHVAVLLAEIAADRGDAAGAARHLSEAQRLAGPGPAIPATAGVTRAAARLRLLEDNPAAAAPLFDEEARLQGQAGRYPEMARALSRAGGAYASAGQPALAADRLYRAGASYHAQERPVQARQALAAARSAAARASDRVLLRLIDSVLAEMPMASTAPVEVRE